MESCKCPSAAIVLAFFSTPNAPLLVFGHVVSHRRALENTRGSRFAHVEWWKELSLRRRKTVFLLCPFSPLNIVISVEGDEPFFFFLTPTLSSPPHPNAKIKNTTQHPAQRIHFRKEDERLLRKLLAKVKAQADTVRVEEKGEERARTSLSWVPLSFFFSFSLLLSLETLPLPKYEQQRTQTQTKNRPTSTRPRAPRPRRSRLSR